MTLSATDIKEIGQKACEVVKKIIADREERAAAEKQDGPDIEYVPDYGIITDAYGSEETEDEWQKEIGKPPPEGDEESEQGEQPIINK